MTEEIGAKKDCLEFLQRSSTAVVATSYKDDPRASTVYFHVDENFNFYFVTKRKTSKYLNAEINPKMAVVVGTGPEHISVQSHGRVELIVNEDEKERITALITGKQKLKGVKLWPIEELKNLEESHKVVFKFVPDELYFMNLDSSTYPESISDTHFKII